MRSAADPIWVIGAGGHALVVAEAIVAAGSQLGGFVVDTLPAEPFAPDDPRSRLPVLDWSQRPRGGQFALGVGANRPRQALARRLREQDPAAHLVTVIHPHASVSPWASVGEGAVILAMARVAALARLSAGVLINTAAVVEHDCQLGEFASLAPGAVLGGTCKLGEAAAIGLGARLRHGISVGHDCVVGAGSYVHTALPDRVLAWGSPAVVRRERAPFDPYL